MRKLWTRHSATRLPLASAFACAAVMTQINGASTAGDRAQPRSASMQLDADEIGGVATSSKGSVAGVWAIAETTDLPSRFRKIVVTDDSDRYLLAQLPPPIAP